MATTERTRPKPDPEEILCEFCGDHPAEPRVPCCDNGFCIAEWLDQKAER